jgi:hypothetical protein
MKLCKTCNTDKTSKWYSGPQCRCCYRKQLRISNRAIGIVEDTNKWAKANKTYCKDKHREWYYANHVQQLAYQKEYRLKNKDKKRMWERKDRATNLNRRIADNLRNRINMAIKHDQKAGSTVRDLGCSIEEFKIHLEAQFYSNFETGELMTWDNNTIYGWHIDHIRPLISFDLTNREQFLEAASYKNLQPLWAEDNLRKGKKYGRT